MSITVTQTFPCSANKLWEIITQLNHMKQWYFENIPEFEAKVGFKTQFNVTSNDRNFCHLWEVTEVNSPHQITYNWKFKEYTGDSSVSFFITEFNKQTTLTLRAKILEEFPQNIPEFQLESGISGWKYFIKNRLVEYVNNEKEM